MEFPGSLRGFGVHSRNCPLLLVIAEVFYLIKIKCWQPAMLVYEDDVEDACVESL